jgi:alpha-L-fucosidase
LLEVSFDHAVTFDHSLVMEWLNDGQHVEKYAIEVWNDSRGTWETVARGEAIGHEKIDAFPSVTATRVRLNILSSITEAHIREFQLFNWGNSPSIPSP